MNIKMIGRFQSLILLLEALFMLPALGICVLDGDTRAAVSFLITEAACVAVFGIMYFFCRHAPHAFYAKEGLICVGLSWIVMSLFGCMPFVISVSIPNFVDAFFEIVSGFTTTGSSILKDVEILPRGILYWRSFSHWVGGMGVLVFLLAVAPAAARSDGGFAMHIMRAESPGPSVGKLVPRVRQTAMILYLIYIGLTIINIIFLLAGGMPFFDAICTAFGTAGTGGFGIKNDSMAGYSPYIQNVCTVFMLIFGVNFSCYYLLLMRRFKELFFDEEIRLYLGIVAVSIIAIMINVRGMYDTFADALRHSAFQVSSIITTTGFATDNFDLWPAFSKGVLLCLMAVGACAGSTGGGFKVVRLLLMVKNLGRKIRRVYSPQRVQTVKMNSKTVDEKTVDNINTYLAAYVIIVIISFLIVSLDGFTVTTNFSAVMSCFNNIGPGLDVVGPSSNFSAYSPLSKLVLSFDMLAGRLEIFPVLALFSKSTWKRI